MKKFSLNGIEVFPFASEEQILDHIDKNKGILVAINAEKTIKASDRLREIINLNIGQRYIRKIQRLAVIADCF